MPDEKQDIFDYSKYFTKKAPGLPGLLAIIVAVGAVAGLLSFLIVHYSRVSTDWPTLVIGLLTGILVISVPAILTSFLIKAGKRRIPLRIITITRLIVSVIYALMILLDSIVFAFTGNYTISYIILIAGNAGLFGYLILIDKVTIDMKRKATLAAIIQPMCNILLYIAFGAPIFALHMSLVSIILKLVGGSAVFLVMAYFLLYLIDKPMKRTTNVSGISIFINMINQWLYDVKGSDSFDDSSFGVNKKVEVDMLLIKGKKDYKAMFIKPDIHYGPFNGIGGSMAPERIGNMVSREYGAAPFVMHGAVNAADNPISSTQTDDMAKRIDGYIRALNHKSFYPARGGISIGRAGACRCIDIRVNDCIMMIMTKAPLVVEDIENRVGRHFENLAGNVERNRRVMVIDAHNSRFESASREELRGVHKRSKYVGLYSKAIGNAVKKERTARLRCGAAAERIYFMLDKPKDIGMGYSSVCVFEAAGKRLCIVNFDANNMLPAFRKRMREHIRKAFKMDSEILTNDTHSVNTVNLPVDNVLGSKTNPEKIVPILDRMIREAISSMEPVYAHSNTIAIDNFRVWGYGGEEIITEMSRNAIRKFKMIGPIVAIIGLAAAAAVIYVV
jgi:predicted neutral ceramidase superfamily lipid hydrolase